MPSKPALNQSEDLFEESKMTFGQHLEELRSALFKAVIALAIGTCIGLYFGKEIVLVIEHPLKQSLKEYHQGRDEKKLKEVINEKVEEGEAVPGDPDDLATFMAANQLTFDEMLVDGETLFLELKRIYPERFEGVKNPSPSNSEKKTAPPEKTEEVASTEEDGEAEVVPDRKLLQLFVWRKLKDTEQGNLKAFNAQEAFMIWLKAGLIFGFILSSPLVFWFVWDFVRVGLYPHERRYVNLFIPISIGLFLSGAALAFFFVFRYVLAFLFSFNDWLGLEPDMRISEWLSFALFMPVGFGISFQLPLVMLFLERIGVFSVEVYLNKWRVAVMVIAVMSMVLTPAEPTSMLMMATPLWLLYFVGIALCKFLPKGRSPFTDPID